jgi:hypothetical protein
MSGFPGAAHFFARPYPHQNEFLQKSPSEYSSICASAQIPVDATQSMHPVPVAEQDSAFHP